MTRRRLVVFAGPHKSASSSVQELFMKTAASSLGMEKRHPSLHNWTWPWNPRRRSYLPRKGFAPLVTEGEGFIKLIHETVLTIWNETKESEGHLILGTEEFDRFGPTPWSHRDGIHAIERIRDLLKPDSMEIVLNYRRPRRDQWISVWKQLTRSDSREYNEFLCDANENLRIWEYLDCVTNPLGLADALLKRGWEVRLMDMAGIASKDRDVGHVVACDVLGVACDDHWLPGLDHPIQQNKKSGDPRLNEKQLDDMEWILRQRDCSYRSTLVANSNFRVLEGEAIWEDCLDDPRVSTLRNTTWLLQLMQTQVGCRPDGISDSLEAWRKETITLTGNSTRYQSPTGNGIASSEKLRRHDLVPLPTNNDEIILFAKVQLMIVCVTFLTTVLFLLRILKCKVPLRKQRLAGRHMLEKSGQLAVA